MSPDLALRLCIVIALIGAVIALARRALGRVARQAAFASLAFLLTRVPVLLTWAAGAVGMLLLILPKAVARGHDTLGDFVWMGALSTFCGLGVAVAVLGPVWAIGQAFTPAPALPLEPGEELLRELDANHFLGREARGGKLVVTNRRLGFRPHRFNVQLATWSIPLEKIRGFECEGERMLIVETDAPRAEWFVVYEPRRVAEYIGSLASSRVGNE